MPWLQRLNQFKKQAGKTNEDIAQAAGIPKPTVDKIFSGATRHPKINTIAAIVKSLGHTLDDLYADVPAPPVDDELSAYLEELSTRPEQRMLFSLTKNATREEVETAVKIIEAYLNNSSSSNE